MSKFYFVFLESISEPEVYFYTVPRIQWHHMHTKVSLRSADTQSTIQIIPIYFVNCKINWRFWKMTTSLKCFPVPWTMAVFREWQLLWLIRTTWLHITPPLKTHNTFTGKILFSLKIYLWSMSKLWKRWNHVVNQNHFPQSWASG